MIFTAGSKKERRRIRRTKAAYWLAMSAMGTTVAYTSVSGKAATSAYAEPRISMRQAADRYQFNIPAGLLDDVVDAFERTTRFEVIFSRDGLSSLQSPGVLGEYGADRALELMLTGTGITFRHTASTAVILDLGVLSETVDVTTAPPLVAASSPKYTEPLRDVPQTIQVIPRDIIEAQGVTTLSEALRNVPGITLQAGEGGGASGTSGDMFNMRGFNANNSIFVDGVRDDGLISRDVFNLEQVEVFMGPTGSDVGRGTASGYVNMQGKTPHAGPLYSGAYEYGSADRKRMTADFNAPFSLGDRNGWLGQSGFRLNGLWQDTGVPGRDVVEMKSQAIAPSLSFGMGMPTRITFASEIMRQDNVPDYGIPASAWLKSPLAPTTVLAAAPVSQSNYYGSIGYDYDKASRNSYMLRVEREVGDHVTLRNQSRYNQTHRTAVITAVQSPTSFVPDTQTVTLARQGNERQNEITSNQSTMVARFTTGVLRHASTSGIEYVSERQFSPTLTGLGTRNPVSIYNPNPLDPVTGFAPVRTAAYNRGRTNTAALYTFDTISLGDKWQLSGGVRWEHYDTTFRVVDAAGLTTTNERAADGLVSGKAGLLFRPASFANVYFSYGTAVTPPGTANFTLSAQANNQNNPNVKPQTSKNYEVGSKLDFYNGRLSFSTAVFRTENKNVIFTVDATAVPPVFNQNDAQRVNGFSVGTLGRLTGRLQLLGNFSYLDSRLQTQNSANDGKRLTLTPVHSGSLWMTYDLPGNLRLGGGIRYTDAVYINLANTIQSPGYHLADALVEYEVNQHISLRLNVYNLTNQTYIRSVNNNGGRYNPGNPRSIAITPTIHF